MKRRLGLSFALLLLVVVLSTFIQSEVKSSASHGEENAIPDGGLDLIATGMEVTQGTQSLNQTVRLAAGKGTVVRFYVNSNGQNAVTNARLTVSVGMNSVVLFPSNPGGTINVIATPNRSVLNQTFNFQIPEAFTAAGTLNLLAEVNPNQNVAETNFTNNTWMNNVTFETVPPLTLVIYNLGYTVDGTEYYARDEELQLMVDWIRKAWAVSHVGFIFRKESIRETLGEDRLPTCREVNDFLMTKRTTDLQTPANGVLQTTRYYGMVASGGGFMRGCANGLPGFASSGPTGAPRDNNGLLGNWITNGTYGDWYGAHEVAHNLNRRHAEFCNARGGAAFPNPNGSISPVTTGPNAIFGYDLITGALYGPDWTENMAYCAKQWISDFTVNGIMTFMQQNLDEADQPDLSSLIAQDSLLVVGTIKPTPVPTVELKPVFFIPNATDVTNHTTGTYAIVLRNAANVELFRYPFAPDEIGEEDTETQQFPIDELAITELVPYSAGTTKVEIEAPGGAVLSSISAGINNPTVGTPTVGTITAGQPVSLNWTAADSDGDPLTFNVQYSNDNGATWRIVSAYLKGSAIQTGGTFTTSIDSRDITKGAQAEFRVIASDGIHTGTGTSAPFNVPNHTPTVSIERPGDDTTVTLGEAITLSGNAYDIDEGLPPASEMQWSSSINGALGTGYELTVSNLSLGTHTITFTVNDGDGGIVSDTITLEVTTELVRRSVNDFDGDGETDLAVFRSSNGTWYFQQSSDGLNRGIQWGMSGDIPVQADFDHDGTTDVAVFRESNGVWYIRESAHGTVRFSRWGMNGDIPVAGDYDGDDRIDLAVFRPSVGAWFIRNSVDNSIRIISWGVSTDQPVQADYDGDALTDIAVYRPGNNVWYIINSSTGAFRIQTFGAASDVVVPEDYDGDGEKDLAIFRPGDGNWWTLRSNNSTTTGRKWGVTGDKPVAGDYDGDGLADLVVFRPSEGAWYILQSSNGTVRSVVFGASTDIPV